MKRVTEPFKCCNRKFHPEDMVVEIGDVKVGGGNFVMIAGPCEVESEEQIVTVAKAVKAAGAQLMRGGAFKPRTSPKELLMSAEYIMANGNESVMLCERGIRTFSDYTRNTSGSRSSSDAASADASADYR